MTEHRTGSITDFRNPGQPKPPGPVILGQHEHVGPVTTHAVPLEVEEVKVDVRVHENVVHEGEGQVRPALHEDGIEIRLREGADRSEWEKIKRGDDK